MFSKRADSQIAARQVKSFFRAQLAPNRHFAVNIVTAHMLHQKLDKPVVKEKPVAGFDHFWEWREAHRNTLGITNNFFAGERKILAGFKFYRLGFDFSQAHFRAGKIRHDSDS